MSSLDDGASPIWGWLFLHFLYHVILLRCKRYVSGLLWASAFNNMMAYIGLTWIADVGILSYLKNQMKTCMAFRIFLYSKCKLTLAMICRNIPERVFPFSKGACRNSYEFCCARSSMYRMEPLPTAQELQEKSRPYTCLDFFACRCCCWSLLLQLWLKSKFYLGCTGMKVYAF